MKKPRVSTRRQPEDPKLEMTPMIDVVFQLLIFFIVTLKQEDVLAHLDVSRPAPDPSQKKEEVVEDLLTVTVFNEGFVLKGRIVSLRTLDKHFTKLAKYSKTVSVIVKCTGDSPHTYLVQLLDLCAKCGLQNISVFSL